MTRQRQDNWIKRLKRQKDEKQSILCDHEYHLHQTYPFSNQTWQLRSDRPDLMLLYLVFSSSSSSNMGSIRCGNNHIVSSLLRRRHWRDGGVVSVSREKDARRKRRRRKPRRELLLLLLLVVFVNNTFNGCKRKERTTRNAARLSRIALWCCAKYVTKFRDDMR